MIEEQTTQLKIGTHNFKTAILTPTPIIPFKITHINFYSHFQV